MPNDKTLDQSAKMTLARVLQIKDELKRVEAETQAASAALAKAKQTEPADILKLENKYHATRLELYNELVQIESAFVQPGETPREDIVALSKQLDLGETLKKQRVAQKHAATSRDFCGMTDCSRCVYDCATCVSTCGLNGGGVGCTFGAPGIAGQHTHRDSGHEFGR